MSAPLFSIVTPVYEPPLKVFRETFASVVAQELPDWEWILVDDASPSPKVRDWIREQAATDPRIRLVERADNGHIVRATNDGVDAARGEFIAFVDHDDLLTPDALAVMARQVAAHDDVDYLYSDEDKADADGTLHSPFPKPDWSPERLRGQMYTSHLSVMRTSLVREVGGLREGYDGSQDHDLALRVSERARRVVHVPKVLYHWRAIAGSAAADIGAKPYATIAGQRAVQDQLDRLGIRGRVEQGAEPGRYVIQRELDPAVRVSIVIPTLGGSALVFGERRVLVEETVRTALALTDHDDVEVVVVHDTPTPPAVLDRLREIAGDKLVLVEFEKPFNFSEKCNVGALHATGERLVFLNDDVEVISERWLENLVGPLDEPDVGLTGAKLYFSDSSIQHACHGYWNKHYHHPFRFRTRQDPGPFGELAVNREVTGVTAACAAIRREVFLEIGGFTEALPSNFNDVDFCYKVAHHGYRTVWVANCELFHFESQTRDGTVQAWERHVVVRRWGVPDVDRFTPAALASPMLDPHRLLDMQLVESRPAPVRKRAGKQARA
ncbi:Glycosyltransferase, GT2 family [Nocardioides exalbidus]|uniref:Glycosyltransferase, GT2 family n=1 Tax=Nocardioides exalbidus TaxID=402596 RepID=A0A1H4JFJ4_9ACTN|nr:glycosyltransferase [Nocardioides exalbidus]SEB45001.1 Glycosyltransferase, GT2 family [Nocardioides exalbidus]